MLNDIVYFHSLTLSGLRAFLLKARGQYYEQETGARSPAIAKYSSHLKRNVFSFHPFEKPAWAHMYTHTEHTMYTSTHARTHTQYQTCIILFQSVKLYHLSHTEDGYSGCMELFPIAHISLKDECSKSKS